MSYSTPWTEESLRAFHCVRVCLYWTDVGYGTVDRIAFDLEYEFWQMLGQIGEEYPDPRRGVGAYCGREWIVEHEVMVLYGRDADRLWEAILPALQRVEMPAGSYVVKRHGAPGAPEERIELSGKD